MPHQRQAKVFISSFYLALLMQDTFTKILATFYYDIYYAEVFKLTLFVPIQIFCKCKHLHSTI